MFEYLANAPTPQVIGAAYYAIRLLTHRAKVQGFESSISELDEAFAEEKKIISKIVDDIQRMEAAALNDLNDFAAEKYVIRLSQITEDRSRQQVQQAGITPEKANELLNELVEPQMEDSGLPALTSRESARFDIKSMLLDMQETLDVLERARKRSVAGDYSERHERARIEQSPFEEYVLPGMHRYSPYDEPEREGFSASRRFRLSDRRLAQDIVELLEHRLGRQAQDINVHVNNGAVVLTGTVPDIRTIRSAAALAERCAGLDNVRNLLRESEGSTYRNRDYYYGGGGGRYLRQRMYPGLAHRWEDDEEDERDRFERGYYK